MINNYMNRFIALVKSDDSYFFGQTFASIVVLVLATCVLFLGIAYSILLGNSIRFSDERTYVTLANNLVSNNFYSVDSVTPDITRPPGYSLFLYSVFLLGGDIVNVRIVQFVLLSLSILLIYKILILWSYRLASVIAGILVFLYPVLFFTAGALFPQTVTAFLFLLVCYLVVRRGANVTHCVFGGLAFGAVILTTPTFLIICPLLILALCALSDRNAFRASVLFLLSSTVVVTPWMVRNYVMFNQFVPLSTSGYMLFLGNSENTRASLGPRTDISQTVAKIEQLSLSQMEVDVFYRSKALNWIWENKGKAATLYLSKFLNHFHYRNELGTRKENTVWRDVVMFVTYYFLLSLATLRVVTGGSLKARPFEMFAVVSYLVIAAAYAIFFTRIRYRLPLDWMLIAIAAIYIATVLEGIKARTARLRPIK